MRGSACGSLLFLFYYPHNHSILEVKDKEKSFNPRSLTQNEQHLLSAVSWVFSSRQEAVRTSVKRMGCCIIPRRGGGMYGKQFSR